MRSQQEFSADDIQKLISDREKFETFVYTPVDEAIAELKRRRQDEELTAKVSELLNGDVPDMLSDSRIYAIIFRQITSPNYEIRRFFHIVKALDELTPFFGEYRDDKFTTNNDHKHAWGKLLFHKEHNSPHEHVTIIDLIASDGKKISEIKTLWGQPLVGFHHELLENITLPISSEYLHDISPWLKKHGGSAKNYYKQIMYWFIQHAILFENFMHGETKETTFTKDIFLPAFMEAYEKLGLKPLIVNLLPTTIENEKFWLSHPLETKKYVENKLGRTF